MEVHFGQCDVELLLSFRCAPGGIRIRFLYDGRTEFLLSFVTNVVEAMRELRRAPESRDMCCNCKRLFQRVDYIDGFAQIVTQQTDWSDVIGLQ